MEELNIISDNGCGFIIKSAGLEPTAEEKLRADVDFIAVMTGI